MALNRISKNMIDQDFVKKVDDTGIELDQYKASNDENMNDVTTQLAQTASKSELMQKINKGEVSVFDIDKNKGKIDQTYLTDELLQQMTGTTPINSVPADRSITLTKIAFSKTGKNLFNKNEPVETGTINADGSIYAGATSFSTSGFIPIKPGVNYAFTNVYRLLFLKSDETPLTYYNEITNPITSPADASYIRISFNSSYKNSVQVEEGDAPTSYEEYYQIIPKKHVEKHDFNIEDIPEGSMGIKQTDFVTLGKNLFNKGTAIVGNFVNQSNGVLSAHASYDASDFIEVEENTKYSMTITTVNARIAFYNENKVFISGLYPATNPITTPVGTRFVRFSFPTGYLNEQQFELGDTITSYEPYGYAMPKLLLNGAEKEEVLIFLPDEICIAVGRTIELYNKQVVWCGNVDNYHFKWSCSVGKAMKRKWTFTGVAEKVGSYPITLTVYNNNMKEVAKATSTVKVVSNTLSTTKSLLTIGDSLTNGKPWLGELRTLSNSQINLVGTRGTAPLQHEGRSGFAASEYLTGTDYPFESEGVHPFWDGTRFNWNHYKTQTGVNPNVVQIYLGTNEMALDPTSNANNIKQLVDYIRQDDSTIPIFVVFTLFRGNQDGIGNQTSSDGYSAGSSIWKLEEDRKVFNLMVRLNSLLKAYTNLYFVPVALTHDSEYNFGAVETPVNPRATQKEYIPSEATHPQLQGYLQMADAMYSSFVAHLN